MDTQKGKVSSDPLERLRRYEIPLSPVAESLYQAMEGSGMELNQSRGDDWDTIVDEALSSFKSVILRLPEIKKI